ncbi:cytidyltransferase [Synechococcus phage S-SSM4]|uniref:Gp185 n=1 Tax=Synechococcus phage S-SSM4 TaxID=536466 RepID=M1T2D2_9CAUD|nr:cytidyltransferase [Synechococcus phage S-SSM4]AGG54210.1 hypothetical protein CYXG_00146 [Synechococcus phage S-SSM4]AGG54431.1 hypothetical protein CYWG_00147 [Cyanophage S-SSM6b]
MNLKELPDMTDAYRQVYEKKAVKDYDGDGKVESGAKEHAGAVHNAIQKKKGLKPDGKDTRSEAVEMSKKDYAKIHKDFKSDDPKNPRTTKYVPGKGTVSMPVKFTDEYHPEGEEATEAVYGGGKKEEPKKASAAAGTGKYYNEKKPTAMQLAKRAKMAKVKALTNAGKHKEASALYNKEETELDEKACWDTHKKVGMKMKGGKLVNDCRPKNEAFAFSEEEFELLEQNWDEIDQLTDEELTDFFIEAIEELAVDEEDLTEICEHLEGVEVLTEDYYDSAVKSSKAAAAKIKKEKGGSKMDRLKSAAKRAGSMIKKGVKAVGKKAAQTAGKVAGEFSAAKDKQKAKAMARKDDDGPKKSSGVTKPTPSSTGVASRSTSGGSSSGGSKGETRKAVGGALKKVGSLVKKGLKKAVGKTARLVSKGSDKVAKKLGEDFDQIESLVESGLFKWDEIENILEHHKKDADGNTIPHEGDEVEEGYKPIDKKKETKMYRRAGNLSRDALSKGLNTKAGSKAQDKSGKIVSAITRQKEKERFSKMADIKARSNYNG